MSSLMEKTQTDPANQQGRIAVKLRSEVDTGLLRMCCGNPIAPRLAEIRQPEGATVFVAVWHCPQCNRWTC